VAETDRYLDTPEGALAAARWACRLREREGVTRLSLKGPAEVTDGAWHPRRPEVEGPATASVDPTDWPESDARRTLAELAGEAELVERLELRQERTERPAIADGEPVATLSLDVVDVLQGGWMLGRMLIVELELASDEALRADRFEALAAELAARPGLHPDPRTKLEHALEMLDGR
jgi:inorganic triphosphatase YgiF